MSEGRFRAGSCDAEFGRILNRQQVLADFGDFALRSEDLEGVLAEACRLVGEALGTGRAKVLEIQHEEQSLWVRAGVGWAPGIVGHLRLPMQEHSSETFAIKAAKPVVTRDIAKEARYDVPLFMKEAGAVALANVPIFLPGGRPYGLLKVDDVRPRDFDEEDTQFLRTYAAILGPAIGRLLMAGALRSTEERFRLTVEAVLDYAIFLTDPQDRITDWLPGAQAVFGWTAEEAVGQPGAIIFTPEDRESRQDEWEFELARKEGVAPDVRWHLRRTAGASSSRVPSARCATPAARCLAF
jgi:PAS domain S-box-containing protein